MKFEITVDDAFAVCLENARAASEADQEQEISLQAFVQAHVDRFVAECEQKFPDEIGRLRAQLIEKDRQINAEVARVRQLEREAAAKDAEIAEMQSALAYRI